MVQSPSWEANWFAIPCILWNPNVHYRTHNIHYFDPSQGYYCINCAFCPPYLQGDSKGNVNILGSVRMSYCENIISYKHMINFKWLPTYLLTYFMVQSPPWGANWFAIPCILWNPNIHYRTHNIHYFDPSQGYYCINCAFCPPYLQGDSKGNVNILGSVRMSYCENIISYKHMINFKWLPRWGCLDLET